MYYKPLHFTLKELVSPKVYEKEGESALRLLDAGLLKDLDKIRNKVLELTGQYLIVNDWSWGGNYTESGLRTVGDTYYKPTSAHSSGRGFDIKLSGWLKGDYGYDADWLRSLTINMKGEGDLEYLSELEMSTETWVHIGSRNNPPNYKELFVFNP